MSTLAIMRACYRAMIERSRAYAVDTPSNSVDGSTKPESQRRPDPEMAFVTTTSSTSNVERLAIANRKLPVRYDRKSIDSASSVIPSRAGRRRSRQEPSPMELENYGVPYESPRADERSAGQPCAEGSAAAAEPPGSPHEAVVNRNGPDTNEAEAAAAKLPTSPDDKDAGKSDGGLRSLASSETVFKRSTSLRSSSNKAWKRPAVLSDVVDDDDVGRVFVRQRAASFSGDRTSTKIQKDVGPRQRLRRRMSSFGLLHPPDDQARTEATTPGICGRLTSETSNTRVTRGRANDERGLPPIQRPASRSSDVDERRRRLPRADDAAVSTTPATVTLTSDRSATSGTSKWRRRSDDQTSGDDEKLRKAEDSGRHRRHHRHRLHRHRTRGENDNDDDEGKEDKDGRRRRHHHHRRRSTSEQRRTSSDGEHRTEESTSRSALDDDRHRCHHHQRTASLDRGHLSTPSVR